MDNSALIVGIMATETDALGFIPYTKLHDYYIPRGQYIIAYNQHGYLLHGRPKPGGIMTIHQAIIEHDWREKGYGYDMLETLIERAKQLQSRSIALRCAADLAANEFWQHNGFIKTKTEYPNNRRQRGVNTYVLDLWPRLFR